MAGSEPVVREIEIAASPEVVFEFFVDAEKRTRWLAVAAKVDPRPGGVCHQEHDRGVPGAAPFQMLGEFLEVDPPRRVVFTWGFPEPEVGVPVGSSRVEVTLQPFASGTRVRLEHHGLPESEVPSHAAGWTGMLARLAEVAEESAA